MILGSRVAMLQVEAKFPIVSFRYSSEISVLDLVSQYLTSGMLFLTFNASKLFFRIARCPSLLISIVSLGPAISNPMFGRRNSDAPESRRAALLIPRGESCSRADNDRTGFSIHCLGA